MFNGFYGFVTRLTRREPLVQQELLTVLAHPNLLPVFSGVRPFFDHCVWCSSIDGFWLPLMNLQTPPMSNLIYIHNDHVYLKSIKITSLVEAYPSMISE
jgi:hypothetical protein